MSQAKLKPDCCERPQLNLLFKLFDNYSVARSLMKCGNCGRYWQEDYQERMNFSGGEDQVLVWHTELTDEQAQELMASQVNQPLQAECPFCNRLVDEDRGHAYPTWECPCGAHASGARPHDLDDAADYLLNNLGLDLRASEPSIPVGESGMLSITPYDAHRVKQKMGELLAARGYEVRHTQIMETMSNPYEPLRERKLEVIWVKCLQKTPQSEPGENQPPPKPWWRFW